MKLLKLNKNMSTQVRRLATFIKYHNGFVIGLILTLFASATIFAANTEIADTVIGEEITTEQGIDNSQIINADLETFDLRMKIENVTEDEENYYIDYSFQTLGVKDNVWQTINRANVMTVSKISIAGKDLGLYVQAQLSHIAKNELTYLKQAQTAETEKGLTQIVRTTEYTGLIGLILDTKTQTLSGYDPVVKTEVIEPVKPEEQEEIPQEEIIEETVPETPATTTQEIGGGSFAPQGEAQTSGEDAVIEGETDTGAQAETEEQTQGEEPQESVPASVIEEIPDAGTAATSTEEG
jgi:hypothetical protein